MQPALHLSYLRCCRNHYLAWVRNVSASTHRAIIHWPKLLAIESCSAYGRPHSGSFCARTKWCLLGCASSRHRRQTHVLRRLHSWSSSDRTAHAGVHAISGLDVCVSKGSCSYRRRAPVAGTATVPEPIGKSWLCVVAIRGNPVCGAGRQRSAARKRDSDPSPHAMASGFV